jgi:hypothetical protein
LKVIAGAEQAYAPCPSPPDLIVTFPVTVRALAVKVSVTTLVGFDPELL